MLDLNFSTCAFTIINFLAWILIICFAVKAIKKFKIFMNKVDKVYKNIDKF